jgi:hypothetical protein
MLQQGQVFRLGGDSDDNSLWAYRYRVGGRGSRRACNGVVSRLSGTRARRSSGLSSEYAASEAVGPR